MIPVGNYFRTLDRDNNTAAPQYFDGVIRPVIPQHGSGYNNFHRTGTTSHVTFDSQTTASDARNDHPTTKN